MADFPNAADLAREIADALDTEGLPYAIGGAIALGYYTAPRATRDVDVNVFVHPGTGLPPLLAVLDRLGFKPEEPPEVLLRNAREDGQFQGTIRGMRVDVFVPALEYYASLESRLRVVSLLRRPLRILAAEDLVVPKMVFFRRKDLADVEALLTDQPEVDLGFVRSTLAGLVAEDDPRVPALEETVSDIGHAG